MLEILQSFGEVIVSIVQSFIMFLGYIPKFFRLVTVGVSTLTTMFNFLPSWVFVIGSVTLAGAVIWIIIEII